MKSLTDFFELTAEKERIERDLAENSKKKNMMEVADDQQNQKATAMVLESEFTAIDHLKFFTQQNRRPRTIRRVLDTTKLTENVPLCDMKDCDEKADGETSSHEEILRREKLLKRPLEVEPESTNDDDDDEEKVLTCLDFFENHPQGKPLCGIVIREGPNNQPEEQFPKKLLKTKVKNNRDADQEIKKTKFRKVLDHNVHRQPRDKIVRTGKLFLDLNQPPPEETQEKKQEKKLKIKKRKSNVDDGTSRKKGGHSSAIDNGSEIPPLRQEVIDRIRQRAEAEGRDKVDNGELILVLQKELTTSDVDQQQNRLIYTKKQLRNQYLTENEEKFLEGRDEKNHHKVIKVPIIEPSKEVESVNFTKWIRGKNSESYLLNQNWRKVVEKNHLQQGRVVQLWAFRINERLHFAFVILPKKKEKNESSTTFATGTGQETVQVASTSKAESSTSPFDITVRVIDEQMASISTFTPSPTKADDENEMRDDQCMVHVNAEVASSTPKNDKSERNTSGTVNDHDTHSNDENKASTLSVAPR